MKIDVEISIYINKIYQYINIKMKYSGFDSEAWSDQGLLQRWESRTEGVGLCLEHQWTGGSSMMMMMMVMLVVAVVIFELRWNLVGGEKD